ncbi:5692_t:CDS:2, partial [Dentiscutata heterogama]
AIHIKDDLQELRSKERSNESSLLSPPPLPAKPITLIGGLSRYIYKHNASASKIKNLWNDQSNMPNISSRTSLDNFADTYFDSVQKNAKEINLISFD